MTTAHDLGARTDDAPITNEEVADALEKCARQLRVAGQVVEQAWADEDYHLAMTAAMDMRAAGAAITDLLFHVLGHQRNMKPEPLARSLHRYITASRELDARVFDEEEVVEELLAQAAAHDARHEAAEAAKEAAREALRAAGFSVSDDGGDLRVDEPPAEEPEP